jgi:MATE family multidrug resistance protein
MQTMPSSTQKLFTPGGVREMLSVAFPMVVSLSCDTLMTFTDRLFLSKLGSESMNAAMGGGLSCFLFMTFFVGLIGYTTALVAQQFGAGHKHAAARAAWQALGLAGLAWPVLLALSPLGPWAFGRLGLSPGQLSLQNEYFRILMFGTLLGLLRGAFSGFFCGIGRTRVVMLSALVALSVNVLAAWLLIFGHWGLPAMGIQGAAIGTIIASLSGLAVLAFRFFSPGIRREFAVLEGMRFDRVLMGSLLRFGYPSGLELFLNVLAFNGIIILMQQQGAAAATAATILFSWDMISFVPLVGVEIGVTSLVGRYVGAGDLATARKAARSGLNMTWGFSGLIFVLFLGVPLLLVAPFRPLLPDPIFTQAEPLAAFMLRMAAIYVLMEGVFLVYAGALRGAGDTFFTMCLTVGMHWLLLLILFFSLKVFHSSVTVAWAWVVCLFALCPFLLWWRWNHGAWERSGALASGAPEAFPPL